MGRSGSRRSRKAPRRRPPASAALADAWRQWIADNLIRGADASTLEAALVAQGVPSALAKSEVASQAKSPLLAQARLAGQRFEMMARLRRALADTTDSVVPRVESLDASAFYRDHYAENRPVVITDWVRRWPAFEKWTPAHFAERLGEVEVTVSVGRDSDPDYDMNEARLKTEMPVAELVRRMSEVEQSNDLYMIARNRNLSRPAFRSLLEDVALDPDIFDEAKFFGGAQLWMGPAGTVTPLHHDTSNILFCQVYGKKRVTLVPRWETSLVQTARQLYATFDPEAPNFDAHPGLTDDRVLTVDLDAGDALFLPVGWWHHVRALTESISLACVNFARNNEFRWYRPNRPVEST